MLYTLIQLGVHTHELVEAEFTEFATQATSTFKRIAWKVTQ